MWPLFSSGPPLLESGREWKALSYSSEYFVERYQVIFGNWPWTEEDDSVEDDSILIPGAAVESDSNDPCSDAIHVKELGRHRKRCTVVAKNIDEWAKVFLIRYIAAFVSHVEIWMQTCDCHPVEMFEDGVLPKGWKCPLSGLKAVSVAQGGLDNFIEEAATMAHSMFMASLPLATSEEMRHYLGQQFFYAKSSIQVQCLVRSRPFRSLPAN